MRVWDILDILVVGYLMYTAYQLLRGSVAINIFIGVVLLYVVWWLVRALKMDLLSLLLGQFVSVGVIIIAIVFQPELRRFLLLLGNQTLRGRLNFLKSISERNSDWQIETQQIKKALLNLSKNHTGVLIILANDIRLQSYIDTGLLIDSRIDGTLLQSIFNKDSPLHDGAVIIENHRLKAAKCILPVSDNQKLPAEAGLRHRAALGISEVSNVMAFVVSEETGKISTAYQGKLRMDLDEKTLDEILNAFYK